MDRIINELIQEHLGQVIDKRRDSRSSDLAYLCGFSDAIKLLHNLDAIKDIEK